MLYDKTEYPPTVVPLLSCVQLFRDLMDCSPQGSSVHGISQARILEWVAISFCRGSSWPRDRTGISCIARQILYTWVTRRRFQHRISRPPMVVVLSLDRPTAPSLLLTEECMFQKLLGPPALQPEDRRGSCQSEPSAPQASQSDSFSWVGSPVTRGKTVFLFEQLFKMWVQEGTVVAFGERKLVKEKDRIAAQWEETMPERVTKSSGS